MSDTVEEVGSSAAAWRRQEPSAAETTYPGPIEYYPAPLYCPKDYYVLVWKP